LAFGPCRDAATRRTEFNGLETKRLAALLHLSRLIDRFSSFIGRSVAWLVLIDVLISALNATIRKVFDRSSNAYLEIQWYLFAAIVLLASGYTLLRQEHVKIDVLLGRFSRRTQVKIELFGLVAFLLPFVYAVVSEVLPFVHNAWVSGEMSENAGGLVRWPVYVLVPIGFTLLGIQAISEIIKRIAFLQGRIPDPGEKQQARSAEEELVEAIRAHTDGIEGAAR
jgi:TRAP-type mannitol/chloroaromatic compound transport system permease small subunit